MPEFDEFEETLTMCDVTSDILTARRLEWIRTLEGGTYEQGSRRLFTPAGLWDETDPASYCCLGVGRDVMNPGYFFTGDYRARMDDDYVYVREHYGFSERVMDRLVALNDRRARDFPFIARFLRKVWGLTGA